MNGARIFIDVASPFFDTQNIHYATLNFSPHQCISKTITKNPESSAFAGLRRQSYILDWGSPLTLNESSIEPITVDLKTSLVSNDIANCPITEFAIHKVLDRDN